MIITISKILNRTDLAISGSHGGLVVTKSARNMMLDFFERPNVDLVFIDKCDEDGEEFHIHYADYSSNGITPNDRITPIGRYATKKGLKPGDNLIFRKEENAGMKTYFIEYIRKLNSAYFVGKSSKSAEALNYEQYMAIISEGIKAGKVRKVSEFSYEMNVKYMGTLGRLTIEQDDKIFKINYNDAHLEENNKYFELDASMEPFELRKTNTWKLEVKMDADDVAERELLHDIIEYPPTGDTNDYTPVPEMKKPPQIINDKVVPSRDKRRSSNALARAGFLCEYDNSHPLFLRKKMPINYTEPHHLIPLQFDELFENSLDVEANIVSLCSHCHNLIHYGADVEKVIRKLWEAREDELRKAGLCMTINDDPLTVDMLLAFYGLTDLAKD